MNLKHLTDEQLTKDLKNLVLEERSLLTQILYHLKEIEARKLFVEYQCSSLFDYACKELKYSSDQAYRRIQAMRLLKQIPEAAVKINTGELSLSNINQAQRFFNENKIVSKPAKIQILKKLVNKSVREGQKEILKLSVKKALPQETKKQVGPKHTQVSFNMSEDLEKKLEDIKALLGPKAYNMSMADLINAMADLASQKLQEQKFGKKRASQKAQANPIAENSQLQVKTMNVQQTPPETSTLNVQGRYIPQKFKYHIWHRDGGQCTKCQSKTNLQLDHIKPVALGGSTQIKNLRLLCFHCNQRHKINMGLGGELLFSSERDKI